MPSVKPFKGVLYNRDKIKDIGSVAAPPYDIIPKEMQDKLYRKNLYNIVKLELGKIRKDDSENNNRYTRARDFFKSWLDKKMLVQDEKESLYIYSQGYKYNGKAINRVGFLGLLGFGEGEKSSVLPHENTLSAPKQDRLNLMRQVHANLSPIFVLFDDESHKATGILKVFSEKNKPVVDIKWDGERHRIWRIDDEKAVKGIEEIMQRADMFIADGHHRFETARNYARELENSGASENAKRLS